jgi:hypothetical protein
MIKGTPEPPPVERDEELEAIIARLVNRLDAAREGSAEYRLIERQLVGLRDGSELGGLIIEEYDMVGRLALP